MKSAKQLVSTAVMKEAYKYMDENPMENLPRLIDWAEKVMKKDYKKTIQQFRGFAKDPSNNWNQLM